MGNKKSTVLKCSCEKDLKGEKAKFTHYEIAILEKIYTDLAARNGGPINKETFLQFFPFTGLWGERIFGRFDKDHDGTFDFSEFLGVLSYCCKCSTEQKVQILFNLYDADRDGYLEKKDVLCMLYNYPKSHLKIIIEDVNVAPDRGKKMMNMKNFEKVHSMTNLYSRQSTGLPRKSVDSSQDIPMLMMKKAFSAMHNNVHRKNSDEEKQEAGQSKVNKPNGLPHSMDDVPQEFEQEEEKSYEAKHKDLHRNVTKHNGISNSQHPTASKSELVKRDALNTPGANLRKTLLSGQVKQDRVVNNKAPAEPTKLDLRPITIPVATNVNNRLKKYASYLFESCERAKATGKLSLHDFQNWIQAHPAMIKFFNESFHQELWEAEPLNSENKIFSSSCSNFFHKAADVSHLSSFSSQLSDKLGGGKDDPRSKIPLKCYQKPPEFASILRRYEPKSSKFKKQLFELRDHCLFYYNHRRAKLPDGIICLDGCCVEVKEDEVSKNRFGFTITHKSPTYPTHHLYCSCKEELDAWMNHLEPFQQYSIKRIIIELIEFTISSSNLHQFYTIGPKIGGGKFSVVSKCTSKIDGKEYAIKVINKQKLSSEEREFLLDETSMFKVLNHKNIIKHIDTIENKSFLYIITELVGDGDLFDYVLKNEFLEEVEAQVVMKQLLDCLSYLHDTGIIHRDLKPENILILLDPSTQKIKEIKLIDFGFAKFVTEDHKLTETCGTPNYAAPEVYIGKGYDQRADIWSVGIIMHFLLNGTLPFDADDLETIVEQTVLDDLELEGRFWQNVSPEAKDLLTNLLRKDPSERISVKEALQHPWIKKTKEELLEYYGANFKRQKSPLKKNK